MELDRTDIAILKLLRENSRMSLKEISNKVMLSQPSVKTRLNKLIDHDYITSFTVGLNYNKLGFHITFIIRITDITVPFTELLAILKTKDEVLDIYSVTGSDNYIVKGFAKSTQNVDRLLSELMGYGKINTSIILDSYSNDSFLDILLDST